MPIKRRNQDGDIARCQDCGRKIRFRSGIRSWSHAETAPLKWTCWGRHVWPDDVWRLSGTFGPRADGRRYYIYHNYATEQIHYKWDLEFWLPTSAYKLMSEALPMTKVSPLGTPGY